jgi:exoribonuclease II
MLRYSFGRRTAAVLVRLLIALRHSKRLQRMHSRHVADFVWPIVLQLDTASAARFAGQIRRRRRRREVRAAYG